MLALNERIKLRAWETETMTDPTIVYLVWPLTVAAILGGGGLLLSRFL